MGHEVKVAAWDSESLCNYHDCKLLFSQREGKAMEVAWQENRNHSKSEMTYQRVKLNWRGYKQPWNWGSLGLNFVAFSHLYNKLTNSTQFLPQTLVLGNQTGPGQYIDSRAQLRRIWEICEEQAFQVAERVAARWGATALKRKCLTVVCDSQTWTTGKERVRASGELDSLLTSYFIFPFFLNACR